MLHCTITFKDTDRAGNRRFLLADRHIYTDQVFAFLIDDRINGDGRLAGLPVTDDQLRWPRPTGIIASIDLMPVWTGVSTS